jgi:hypothetical protein
MALFLMAYNKPLSGFMQRRFGSDEHSASDLGLDDDENDEMGHIDPNDIDEADFDEFDEDDDE